MSCAFHISVSQQTSAGVIQSLSHLALQAQEVRMFNDLCKNSVPFGCFGDQSVDLRRGRAQIAGTVDARFEGATRRWLCQN